MALSVKRIMGFGVHLYTALGIVCAIFILQSIIKKDFHAAVIWMLVSIFIDLTDGILARKARVDLHVPEIDGKRMDLLVDFLNVTFLPIYLIAEAGWLPQPSWIWISIASIASLMNYCLVKTKAHSQGFFQGFPAIYSVFALYGLSLAEHIPQYSFAPLMLMVAMLELLPIRFLRVRDAYMFRGFLTIGGYLWFAAMGAMLLLYPKAPLELSLGSLLYPALYVTLSIYADMHCKRMMRAQHVAQ
jgi:phosphatidylcholine synthase